jgi:L-aspartate oxidase
MPSTGTQRVDFLVLGSGIAGLRAAITLAEKGRVLVLTKGDVGEPQTRCSQPRVAVTLGEDEEVCLHLHDTLRAGEGLCREEAVRVLVEDGPHLVQEVVEWGSRLERNGTKLAFKPEGRNGRSRVLHAHGDSTESEILRVLLAKAKSLGAIQFLPRAFAVDFLVEGGRVAGVSYLDEQASTLKEVRAGAVLLSTGGLGQAYKDTTNPPIACGDGVAMAWRAGAMLSDMEFVQFCPTALFIKGAPRILLTEALLGDGAKLRNIDLERFMPQHHDAAELAPSDIVSRATILELQRTRSDFIYLDLTALDEEHVKKRFAKIYSTCLEFNIDITTDLLPVRPAAHYAMGGVATNLGGATTLDGLYAAGEVAATGVHGANRLPSNSLLEGLVFGARAAAAMIAGEPHHKPAAPKAPRKLERAAPIPAPGGAQTAAGTQVDVKQIACNVRSLLWDKVGIIRDRKELTAAVSKLEAMNFKAAGHHRAEYETENIMEVARAIARSALARQESRGAHYRSDFPLPDAAAAPRHSYLSRNQPVYFE